MHLVSIRELDSHAHHLRKQRSGGRKHGIPILVEPPLRALPPKQRRHAPAPLQPSASHNHLRPPKLPTPARRDRHGRRAAQVRIRPRGHRVVDPVVGDVHRHVPATVGRREAHDGARGGKGRGHASLQPETAR
ncbi:hypothetical protein T484DRAFT_1971957 [Baffinella frigidus]|nr:hypothetical protein T484DRAFT_1971957 [Cryptophyta sp. CCMP2293]